MQTDQNNSEDFVVFKGSPLNNLMTKRPPLNSRTKFVILTVCIAWLPLLIISGIKGTLYAGVQMPFLYDISIHCRLLIALPLFILIKGIIDGKVRDVTRYMSHELMSPPDREVFIQKAVYRAKKLSGSALTEILLLLIVIIATASMVKGGVYQELRSETSSWMKDVEAGTHKMSLAGYWCVFFSIPMMQFFLLRWLWHYFIWVLLLFRVSRTNLNLLPTHADNSGGLGIIMLAQRTFNLFFVAVGVIISGQLMTQLLLHPEAFNAIRGIVVGFIAFCMFLIVLPLFFFIPKLIITKNKGLLDMSKLSSDLSNKFEREWVNDGPVDQILEEKQIDPSLIYDYAGMYNFLQVFRVIPLTLNNLGEVAVLLFLPFIPILFIHYSVAELLQKIAGLLV